MCGICLIAGPGAATENANAMIAAIGHRGPDAAGLEVLNDCALGHRRLSIIDLESGAQPMSWRGRYWLTYNGEIYNYAEVRDELIARGVEFHTHSDSEVILAAYETFGAEMLHRFRGMFAFAIWDSETRTLFAARDLFGEKPFYYAIENGRFFAASEIDSIIAGGVDARLDPSSVDAYLAVGYIPPDRTIYRNVHTLPPGHYLEWNGRGVKVTRYWQPRFDVKPISLDEAVEQMRVLLAQSVRRQMVADVPVGAFLSGGLDSSTIVALMQQQSARPVMTFSVGFGDMINELPYARAVAKQYGTDHHEIDLGQPDVPAMLERMAEVYDEPFSDSSSIPTYLLAGFARKFVKVALSGDGGDELFGGYGWYSHVAMAEKATQPLLLKWLLLRTASVILRHRNLRLARQSSAVGLAARWKGAWTRTYMSQVHFREDDRAKLWGSRANEITRYEPGPYFAPPSGTEGLNEAFYLDMTHYLPGDILVKVDRAAMAHGLETRAPFLDRDLAEFALTLPASLKVRDEELKCVMKEACRIYWPPELRNRPKQGFGAPYRQWLTQPEVQSLARRVFADGSRLRRLLPGVSASQANVPNGRTWLLLTLGLWLDARKVDVG